MSIIIATKPNKTTCEVLGNPDPAKSVLQKHIYSSRPGLSRENKHAIYRYHKSCKMYCNNQRVNILSLLILSPVALTPDDVRVV